MKARQYAEQITNAYRYGLARAKRESENVVFQMVNEATEIGKARKAVRYGSLLSIYKEQHVKWLSVVRTVKAQLPDLAIDDMDFLNYIKVKSSMLYPNLIKII